MEMRLSADMCNDRSSQRTAVNRDEWARALRCVRIRLRGGGGRA
jgi:hypothetical protein